MPTMPIFNWPASPSSLNIPAGVLVRPPASLRFPAKIESSSTARRGTKTPIPNRDFIPAQPFSSAPSPLLLVPAPGAAPDTRRQPVRPDSPPAAGAALLRPSRPARPAHRAHPVPPPRQPARFWYEQPDDEWVLLARTMPARVRRQPPPGPGARRLEQLIPAGCRHRVAATGPDTVWLAVHPPAPEARLPIGAAARYPCGSLNRRSNP